MDPPYPAGVTDIPIQFGSGRRARLYVPALAMMQPPRALIVVLHGGGGEGLGVSEPGNHPLAEFRTVADREGVVVVYPEGSATRDGRLGWTDCRSDNLQASSDDDLGFLRTVVELLTIDYGLPAERVFMAGGSNGAQMTLAYAAVAPESIAAIATSNGNLPENPLLIVLDGVQDPHNLGAILRVADAMGVDAVIAPKDRAVGITATVEKVASGAAETVQYVTVTNLARSIDALKARGIWCIGADEAGKADLFGARLAGPLAWVMGAEGEGLRRLTRERCDELVRIPMFGVVESVNVSVATGICLFESRRQRAAGVRS
jgi:23S rRNA (guanosine2251-2'-O)-methyltransferase